MKSFFNKENELIASLIDKINPLTNKLYVYGESKWANSLLINNFLNKIEHDDKVKILNINCAESPSLDSDFKAFYDEIIYKLKSRDINDKSISIKSPGDFFIELNELMQTNKWNTIYIVFNNFEKLKNSLLSNLNILANLNYYINNDKLNSNLITIFNSLLPPVKIFGSYNNFELFSLFVPNLTQHEITDILLDEHKDNMPNYYEFYVQKMLEMLYKICSSVSELIYIIKSSWKSFQNSLIEDEIYDEWELSNKWKALLKDSISLVYSRMSTTNEMPANKLIDSATCKCLELPYHCRYLLIAGYIASFNNKSTDRDVFVGKTQLSKRQKGSIKKQISKNIFSGPKPFLIDRLFAIYSSILEDSIDDNYWSVEKLVETLVNIRLFVPILSKSDPLNGCKYICVASREFALEISKSLNFDILRYLIVN